MVIGIVATAVLDRILLKNGLSDVANDHSNDCDDFDCASGNLFSGTGSTGLRVIHT